MTELKSRGTASRRRITICVLLCLLHCFADITKAQTKPNPSPIALDQVKLDGMADLIGDTVTVSGISNFSTGLLHEKYMQVFIQSDSTGLSLFSESFDKPIAAGDSIVATGIVQEYFSLIEINVIDYEVYTDKGTLPSPLPLDKTIENPNRYEGMLVAGTGTVVGKGNRYNGKYLLVSPADYIEKSIMVYVTNFHSMYSDFDFESLSVGDNVQITGVLTQYNPDPGNQKEPTYKIHLRTPEDLSVVGISINQIIFWSSVGLAVFGIVIGWIISLRSRVRSKTKELKKSLEEKEVLLKEIHHRVKNNLAIMSGLFELQLDGTENEETEEVLRNSQARLQSMALVHDKLYQTSSLSDIEMRHYIPELVKSLHDSFTGSKQNIELSLDIDDIRLDIEQAIPCGLLINEIVVNAFKHAFSETESGLISISMNKRHDKVRLIIADNGSGIPDDFDIRQSSSLGMMLIETFKNQLGASLEISNKYGTRFIFKFPIE